MAKFKPHPQKNTFNDYLNPYKYMYYKGFKSRQKCMHDFKYHWDNNKSYAWWLKQSEDFKYCDSFKSDLAYSIASLVVTRHITEDVGENLFNMIYSPDRENLVVALIVIVKFKNKQIKDLNRL